MYLVSDILRTKGREVWSVHPDSTVYQALQMMADKDVGALIVVENNQPMGLFSERDYARKVILAGLSSLTTTVRDIMTSKVWYVTPDHTIEECMTLMSANHVRYLPVIQNRELVGLVSIGDAVKTIMSIQDMEIRQFEDYVTGRSFTVEPLQH